MADPTLTVDTRIEICSAVTVRPGDTLILAVNRTLRADQVAQYKELLKQRLPQIEFVILEAAQLAVYRPKGGADE